MKKWKSIEKFILIRCFDLKKYYIYYYNMFLSDENKSVLWDLMKEADENFKKEVENNVIILKNVFDDVMKNTWEDDSKKELLELNKLFLVNMSKRLLETKYLIGTDHIKMATKKSNFEERLKKRQGEFEDSMKKEEPEEVNFQDDYDEPILDIEKELAKKLNERRYDDIDPSQVDDAKKWIGIEGDVSLNTIDKLYKNDNKTNNTPSVNEVQGIFKKLKLESDDIDNRVLVDRIKTIEDKLDYITEFIEKLK